MWQEKTATAAKQHAKPSEAPARYNHHGLSRSGQERRKQETRRDETRGTDRTCRRRKKQKRRITSEPERGRERTGVPYLHAHAEISASAAIGAARACVGWGGGGSRKTTMTTRVGYLGWMRRRSGGLVFFKTRGEESGWWQRRRRGEGGSACVRPPRNASAFGGARAAQRRSGRGATDSARPRGGAGAAALLGWSVVWAGGHRTCNGAGWQRVPGGGSWAGKTRGTVDFVAEFQLPLLYFCVCIQNPIHRRVTWLVTHGCLGVVASALWWLIIALFSKASYPLNVYIEYKGPVQLLFLRLRRSRHGQCHPHCAQPQLWQPACRTLPKVYKLNWSCFGFKYEP